ncbi:hypothetical protein AB3H61_003846 [Acinetobacter baumannii]|nr:hypothetical protein [Acinetobacter baumannii]EKU2756697.1 hypothetical protein [Acinetobacter baumannii]EKU2758618.1 hypothetical protein [Acinetobacter baumannii]EKV3877571.1 hypothetical protein [Acinetobacter baumannii]EKW1018537.1 hypothetical protein [Acinetobacter baumannii]
MIPRFAIRFFDRVATALISSKVKALSKMIASAKVAVFAGLFDPVYALLPKAKLFSALS